MHPNPKPISGQSINAMLQKHKAANVIDGGWNPQDAGLAAEALYAKALQAALHSGKTEDFEAFMEFASQDPQAMGKAVNKADIKTISQFHNALNTQPDSPVKAQLQASIESTFSEKMVTAFKDNNFTKIDELNAALENNQQLASIVGNASKDIRNKAGKMEFLNVLSGAIKPESAHLSYFFDSKNIPDQSVIASLNRDLKAAYDRAVTPAEFDRVYHVFKQCETHIPEENRAKYNAIPEDKIALNKMAEQLHNNGEPIAPHSFLANIPAYFTHTEKHQELGEIPVLGMLSAGAQAALLKKQFEFFSPAPTGANPGKSDSPTNAAKTETGNASKAGRFQTLKSKMFNQAIQNTQYTEEKGKDSPKIISRKLELASIGDAVLIQFGGDSSEKKTFQNAVVTPIQNAYTKEKDSQEQKESKQLSNVKTATVKSLSDPIKINLMNNIILGIIEPGQKAASQDKPLIMAHKAIYTQLQQNPQDIDYLGAALEQAYNTATTREQFDNIYSIATKYKSAITPQALEKYSNISDINKIVQIATNIKANVLDGISETFEGLSQTAKDNFSKRPLDDAMVFALHKDIYNKFEELVNSQKIDKNKDLEKQLKKHGQQNLEFIQQHNLSPAAQILFFRKIINNKPDFLNDKNPDLAKNILFVSHALLPILGLGALESIHDKTTVIAANPKLMSASADRTFILTDINDAANFENKKDNEAVERQYQTLLASPRSNSQGYSRLDQPVRDLATAGPKIQNSFLKRILKENSDNVHLKLLEDVVNYFVGVSPRFNREVNLLANLDGEVIALLMQSNLAPDVKKLLDGPYVAPGASKENATLARQDATKNLQDAEFEKYKDFISPKGKCNIDKFQEMEAGDRAACINKLSVDSKFTPEIRAAALKSVLTLLKADAIDSFTPEAIKLMRNNFKQEELSPEQMQALQNTYIRQKNMQPASETKMASRADVICSAIENTPEVTQRRSSAPPPPPQEKSTKFQDMVRKNSENKEITGPA